ncbi:MAG: SusC/RagA family TonB-linked outer membrane protein [Prevotellaceae bacterium]|nr:SusC/RagA family TonB-linked outer membrane protein [Prevotellaceae bacterium]
MKTLLKVVNLNMFRTIVTVFFMCGYSITLFAQGKITGKVSDEAGNPLAGVSVVLKGTNSGISTSTDGSYSISVTSANDVLVFSLVGFVQQEIVAGSRTTINVALSEETTELEEVVVLGYGAQMRKADLSAAVGTIANIEAVKQRPVTSVGGMLQGQIPGVTVRNNTGDPTEAQNIVIRGVGSQGAENVLIVVDGVPGANYNIDEVESVVVLKDAASAAIYGAQSGSAGVILITTKRAKAGRTAVEYDGNFGFNNAVNLPQSLTIEQERALREFSYRDAGQPLPSGWDPELNPYIRQTRTDWMDVVFRTGVFQRHTVALSGGTDEFSNRLSLNYVKNEGTLVGTFSETYQLRYNAEYKLNRYVKIREDAYVSSGSGRGAQNQDAYDGIIYRALAFPRSAEAYYSDGSFGGTTPNPNDPAVQNDPHYQGASGLYPETYGDLRNPLRDLVSKTQLQMPLRFRSSTFLEVGDIVKGLRFTSRFTYYLEYGFDKTFDPKITEPGKPKDDNSLSYSASRNKNWESENTLNYDRTFGKHTVGALASITSNESISRNFSASMRNFDIETPNMQYFSFGTKVENPTDDSSIDRNLSLVGRASYSYDNRYFMTASVRRDYAGRLGQVKKYADFPAFTLAWKLSEEPFMPKIDAVNLIKFRGSWGRIGNLSSIGWDSGNAPGPAASYWRANGRGNPIGIDSPIVTRSTTLTGTTSYNPYLTWETSEQTDFGIDLELLNSRLSLSADWFNKRTFDLIQNMQMGLPNFTGISPIKINSGEITNTGLEFTAGWKDKIGNVSYFIGANLSTLKNKITNIGDVDPNTGEKPVWVWSEGGNTYRGGILAPYRSREGDPLYCYWLVKTGGLFQSDAEAAAYVDKDGNRIQPNAKAGDLKFIDQNGDGKIDDNDRVYMGSYFPPVTYAVTGGLTWKNLSFSFMLQGVSGSKIFHAFKYMTLNESVLDINRWNHILDAYPKTNDIPRITRVDDNHNFSTNSDWYLEDGSYLRIKNVSLSYDLNSVLRKIRCFDERKSSLSVTLGVENLATFTKYSGMDPEVGGKGLDGGAYPVPRTVSISLKLTY